MDSAKKQRPNQCPFNFQNAMIYNNLLSHQLNYQGTAVFYPNEPCCVIRCASARTNAMLKNKIVEKE